MADLATRGRTWVRYQSKLGSTLECHSQGSLGRMTLRVAKSFLGCGQPTIPPFLGWYMPRVNVVASLMRAPV